MRRVQIALAPALSALGLVGALALPAGCDSFGNAPAEDAGAQETSAAEAGDGGDATTGTAYESAVLADRPVVFWRFAAKSTTQPDRGSANVAATLRTDVRTNQASLVNDAADKSIRLVAGDTITSASSTADWTGARNAFAVECWVQVLATAKQADILFRGTTTNGVGLAFDGAGRVKATRADNGVATSVTGQSALTPGVNHHLVLTYDGAVLSLFLDGAVVDSQPSTVSLTSAKIPITIGTTSDATPAVLDAFVDEVAFYDHPLNVERVRAHAQAAAPDGH
jgi:hypothetical protein